MDVNERVSWRALAVCIGLGVVVGIPATALADAYGKSFNHSAVVGLDATVDSMVSWSADAETWYLNAQGDTDHSDSGPDSAADTENFEPHPPADGMVNVASVLSPGMARVMNAAGSTATLLPDDTFEPHEPDLSIDEAFASVLSTSNMGQASALVEVQNMFRLVPTNPKLPPPSASVLINVLGEAHLLGDSLPTENWAASYVLHIAILDADAGCECDPPILYSMDFMDALQGPGLASLDAPIEFDSGEIELELNHDYFLYASFSANASALVPEPSTVALLVCASACAIRRRRIAA